jgi:hypothetical protein
MQPSATVSETFDSLAAKLGADLQVKAVASINWISRRDVETIAPHDDACQETAIRAAIERLDYRGAFIRLLARAVRGLPLTAEMMATVFPWVREPVLAVTLIALAEGDRAERLVELSEQGRFPEDSIGSALRILGLHAARTLGPESLRPRIVAELRRFLRRFRIAPRTYLRTLIAELARSLDDGALAHEYADTATSAEMLTFRWALCADRDHVVRVALESLDRDQRLDETQWHPAMARNVHKTGRNEPCPCNSGKKYKRCHGAVDDKVEPVTPAGLGADQIDSVPAVLLAELNPDTLADDALVALFARMLEDGRWEHAERLLHQLGRRPSGAPHVEHYRARMLESAMAVRRYDVARRQEELILGAQGIDATPGVGLRLAMQDFKELPRWLAAAADRAVRDESGRHGLLLAHVLMPWLPGLAILVARGCPPSDDDAILATVLEDARARIGLPHRDSVRDALAERARDRELKAARAEAEGLSTKLEDARRRADEAAAGTQAAEHRIHLLEEQLHAQHAQPATDAGDPRILRDKIDELQARIREGNEERAELRRQLAEEARRRR